MRNLIFGVVMTAGLVGLAHAQTAPAAPQGPFSLSEYVHKNGFINVQALTYAQLANTYQEDADMLMTWYSDWYNGLAKKHYFHLSRSVAVEQDVIVYCKENRKKKVIEAIAVIFKDEWIKKSAKMN